MAVYKTISVDPDTHEKLRILADGKPIAVYLRELVNGADTITQRMDRLEEQFERMDLGDVLKEGVGMTIDAVGNAAAMPAEAIREIVRELIREEVRIAKEQGT